ncbi:MAG: TVP38/TMEM64 family protein [Chthoniobacterales bacterium]
MKKYTKLIVFALVLITFSIAAAVFPVRDWIRNLIDWVQQLGPAGIAVFIGAYAIATVLFLPGWIFTVTAGLLFGVVGGTAVALSGATIGAALAFLVARYLVRESIRNLAGSNPRFHAIDQAIGENGWKIVGLLRLNPLIPFNLSNYFYGITAIRFWPYVLISAIGMLPGTLLYAYLGAVGKATLAAKSPPSVWRYLLLGVGLGATIAVTIVISRIARKALKKSGAVNTEHSINHAWNPSHK